MASSALSALLDERVLSGVIARARSATTLASFNDQGERCGWCSHPIRLIGAVASVDSTTGEILRTYSTNDEPDGVLLKACGTRRATRCPSCAATYASDARMLVRAGMSGGKGVPESVSQHPMVFATFTAPSFGAVHGTRSGDRTPCHPGASKQRCVHGKSLTCWQRHRKDESVLGEPLCPDCYDYQRSILWNATCPELWRRTTIYVRRELARQLGVDAKQFDRELRLSFAKVAEFQRRGVVHLHAVIRLDERDDECTAPRAGVTTSMLIAALHAAVQKVSAPLPRGFSDDSLGLARWGQQLDLRVIAAHEQDSTRTSDRGSDETSAARSSRAVANYVAKYATKSTDDAGALDRRLTSLDDLSARGVSAHLYRLVETAWNLGVLAHLPRLRAWAHSLGFGGHWLTKSRRYSVTFSFLRSQRQAWQVQRRQGIANASAPAIALGVWKWVGTGWRTAGDEWIAALRQIARLHSRLEARDARRSEAETFTDIEHQWTSEFSRISMTSLATMSPNIAKGEMSNDRREGSDEGE
ncbi:MAG: replication initiation protein [Acidimicrobiaceae bacterium]|nr:replication initiation protein [Acidimicrobiaceae bacterium]